MASVLQTSLYDLSDNAKLLSSNANALSEIAAQTAKSVELVNEDAAKINNILNKAADLGIIFQQAQPKTTSQSTSKDDKLTSSLIDDKLTSTSKDTTTSSTTPKLSPESGHVSNPIIGVINETNDKSRSVNLMHVHLKALSLIGALYASKSYYNINHVIQQNQTWLSGLNLQTLSKIPVSEPYLNIQNIATADVKPPHLSSIAHSYVPYTSPEISSLNLERADVESPKLDSQLLHMPEISSPEIISVNLTATDVLPPELLAKNVEFVSLMEAHYKALTAIGSLNAIPAYFNINNAIVADQAWLYNISLQQLSLAPISAPVIDGQPTQLAEIDIQPITPLNLGIVPITSPEIDSVKLERLEIYAPDIGVNQLHTNEVVAPSIDAVNFSSASIIPPELLAKNVEFVSLMEAHYKALTVIGSLNAIPAYFNINNTIVSDQKWLDNISLQPLHRIPISAPVIDGQPTQLAEIEIQPITPLNLGIVPITSPEMDGLNLERLEIDAPNIDVTLLQSAEVVAPSIDVVNLSSASIIPPELLAKNVEFVSLMEAHYKALTVIGSLNAIPAYFNINDAIVADQAWLDNISLQPLSLAPISAPVIDGQPTQLVEIDMENIVTPLNLEIVPVTSPEMDGLNLERLEIDAPNIDVTQLHANEVVAPSIDAVNLSIASIIPPELLAKNVEFVSLMEAHYKALTVIGSLNAIPAYFNINDAIVADQAWLDNISLQSLSLAPISAPVIDGQPTQLAEIEIQPITPLNLEIVPVTSPGMDGLNLERAEIEANIDVNQLHTNEVVGPNIDAVNFSNASIIPPELLAKNVEFVSLMEAHYKALTVIGSLNAIPAYFNINDAIVADQAWLDNISLQPLHRIPISAPVIDGEPTQLVEIDMENIVTPLNLEIVPVTSPGMDGVNLERAEIEANIGVNQLHTNEVVGPNIDAVNFSSASIIPPELLAKNVDFVSLMEAHYKALTVIGSLNAIPAYFNINDAIDADQAWLDKISLQPSSLAPISAPIIDGEPTQLVEIDMENIVTPLNLGIVPVTSPEMDGVKLERAEIEIPNVIVNQQRRANEVVGPNIDAVNSRYLNLQSPELFAKNVDYVSMMDPHIGALTFLSGMQTLQAFYNINQSITIDQNWLSEISLKHISQVSVDEPHIDAVGKQISEIQSPAIMPQDLNLIDVSSPEVISRNSGINAPVINAQITNSVDYDGPKFDTLNTEYSSVSSPQINIDNVGIVNMNDAFLYSMQFMMGLRIMPAYVNILGTFDSDSAWLDRLSWMEAQADYLVSPELGVVSYIHANIEPVITNAVDKTIVRIDSPFMNTQNTSAIPIVAPRVNQPYKVIIDSPAVNGVNTGEASIIGQNINGSNIQSSTAINAPRVNQPYDILPVEINGTNTGLLTFKYDSNTKDLYHVPAPDYTHYNKIPYTPTTYTTQTEPNFIQTTNRILIEYVKSNGMPDEWLVVCKPDISQNAVILDNHVLEEIWVSK